MTEAMTPAATEAPRFPMERTCPYQPPAGYRQQAEDGPLSRVTLYDGRPAWLVTGHAEARALYADPRMSSDTTNPDFPLTSGQFAEIQRAQRAPLIGTDGDEHAEQRRALIPGFAPRRMAQLRPFIQRVVDERLDAMVAQGTSADLVSAFALPVPSIVIGALLGAPVEDHPFFEGVATRLLRGTSFEEVMGAHQALGGYMGELIARKEAEPGDGLIDDLIADRLRPGLMTREEIVSLSGLLLMAGHETTTNMIALGALALLEHPEQLAAFRADPEGVPAAVEELLRFLSVVDGLARVATEDIEIAGTTIRAGEGVVLANAAINRDPAAFPDPDAFDLGRGSRRHLAFGYGVHQCLGHALARLELEIALRSLFDRLPDLRLAVPADELTIHRRDTIQGLVALPVAW